MLYFSVWVNKDPLFLKIYPWLLLPASLGPYIWWLRSCSGLEEVENGASGGMNGTEGQGKDPTISDLVFLVWSHMRQQEAQEARQRERTMHLEHSNTSSSSYVEVQARTFQPLSFSQLSLNQQIQSLWRLTSLPKMLPPTTLSTSRMSHQFSHTFMSPDWKSLQMIMT